MSIALQTNDWSYVWRLGHIPKYTPLSTMPMVAQGVPSFGNPSIIPLVSGVGFQTVAPLSCLAGQTTVHLSNGQMTGHMAQPAAGPATRPLGLTPGPLFLQLCGHRPTDPNQARVMSTSLCRWAPDSRDELVRIKLAYEEAMADRPFGPGGCWAHGSPADVLHFLGIWAYKDGKTNSGKKCHGSVSNAISNLSTLYQMWGKPAIWNPDTFSGNPVHSYEVQCFLRGYGKETAREGFQSKGANPWDHDLLAQLLVILDSTPLKRGELAIVRLRDCAALCMAAHLGKRAKDIGYIYIQDLKPANPCQPAVQPGNFYPKNGDLFVLTMFSKSRQLEPGPPVVLKYTDVEGERECSPLWRLKNYWSSFPVSHKFGNYMFGRTTVPLTTSCLNQRLRTRYFPLYFPDEPVRTVHGLRRGVTQALEAAGFSQSAIMEHLDMRSASTYQRYRDATRHLPSAARG